MKNQTITRAGLKELHPLVCQDWQKRIEKALTDDLFSEKIEVKQSDIDDAFNQADVTQKKALLKYFKQAEKKSILSFKDVLVINGTTLTFKLHYSEKTKDPFEKCQNALAKMFQIAKAYNGDWKPDFMNGNQYKYFMYKYFSGGSCVVRYGVWLTTHCSPLGVYFKNQDDCEDAYSKFKDVYDDFLMC